MPPRFKFQGVCGKRITFITLAKNRHFSHYFCITFPLPGNAGLASRYWDRIPEFVDQALAWEAQGLLRQEEQIVEGFENVPAAFGDLMAGQHIGKVIVRVDA